MSSHMMPIKWLPEVILPIRGPSKGYLRCLICHFQCECDMTCHINKITQMIFKMISTRTSRNVGTLRHLNLVKPVNKLCFYGPYMG